MDVLKTNTMEFQINITAKTITLKQNVELGALLDIMKVWFPKGEWKSWKINCETVYQNTGYPIWIHTPYYKPLDYYYSTGESIVTTTPNILEVACGEATTKNTGYVYHNE